VNSAGRYLVIPVELSSLLNRAPLEPKVTTPCLRWSASRDTVEFSDGRTFLFAAEIASFLEGFASRRALMHFGHVLHFLYLLRFAHTPVTPVDERPATPVCSALTCVGRCPAWPRPPAWKRCWLSCVCRTVIPSRGSRY
jgi:hypothetical protein